MEELFAPDERDYISNPMTIQEICDSIIRIIWLSNGKNCYSSMVVILSRTYKCSEKQIEKCMEILEGDNLIRIKNNVVYLLNGRKESRMMWSIIDEIIRRGKMDGNEVSDYSIHTLGRKKKSAGGCLARAIEYGYIHIIGTKWVNGREVNIYAA